MFTIREQIRIADQSAAAGSANPPQPAQESTQEQSAKDVFRDMEQQQLERPCTKAQQMGQQHQQ